MDVFLSLCNLIVSVVLIAATVDLAVETARAVIADERRHQVMTQLLTDRQDSDQEPTSADAGH